MARRVRLSSNMVDLCIEAVSGEIAGEVAGEANSKGGGRVVIDSLLRTEHKIGSLLRNLPGTIAEKSVRRSNAGAVLCRYRVDRVGPDAALNL